MDFLVCNKHAFFLLSFIHFFSNTLPGTKCFKVPALLVIPNCIKFIQFFYHIILMNRAIKFVDSLITYCVMQFIFTMKVCENHMNNNVDFNV